MEGWVCEFCNSDKDFSVLNPCFQHVSCVKYGLVHGKQCGVLMCVCAASGYLAQVTTLDVHVEEHPFSSVSDVPRFVSILSVSSRSATAHTIPA